MLIKGGHRYRDREGKETQEAGGQRGQLGAHGRLPLGLQEVGNF